MYTGGVYDQFGYLEHPAITHNILSQKTALDCNECFKSSVTTTAVCKGADLYELCALVVSGVFVGSGGAPFSPELK